MDYFIKEREWKEIFKILRGFKDFTLRTNNAYANL